MCLEVLEENITIAISCTYNYGRRTNKPLKNYKNPIGIACMLQVFANLHKYTHVLHTFDQFAPRDLKRGGGGEQLSSQSPTTFA